MLRHHQQAVAAAQAYFAQDPEVLGVLLGGSLAHGFATPASDVDVLIVVSEATLAARAQAGRLTFFSRELCAYPEGYVDGKLLSLSFMAEVAARGSEPARFAFKDAQVLLARTPGLAEAVQAASRYPLETRANRLRRFYAQFEAWHWYAGEALRHGNAYLLGVAVHKLILFGGRLVLAHNARLYPYHKWFLRVLAEAPEQPPGLMGLIDALSRRPTAEAVAAFYTAIRDFQPWEAPAGGWPLQFMHDSEWNWRAGEAATPIDDV